MIHIMQRLVFLLQMMASIFFCTTAGEDTVSMFERDEETGMLTRKFYTSDQW